MNYFEEGRIMRKLVVIGLAVLLIIALGVTGLGCPALENIGCPAPQEQEEEED